MLENFKDCPGLTADWYICPGGCGTYLRYWACKYVDHSKPYSAFCPPCYIAKVMQSLPRGATFNKNGDSYSHVDIRERAIANLDLYMSSHPDNCNKCPSQVRCMTLRLNSQQGENE